jgi:metal-responsive CopG/Arc/MetJ family transcriptional regulator
MRRARVTITLAKDVLERVDRVAKATPGASRSSVMEAWLKRAAREDAQSGLERAITEYYEGMTERELALERAEAAEWARLSTRVFVAREPRSPYGRLRVGIAVE